MKTKIITILVVILAFGCGCFATTQYIKYQQLKADYNALKAKYDELIADRDFESNFIFELPNGTFTDYSNEKKKFEILTKASKIHEENKAIKNPDGSVSISLGAFEAQDEIDALLNEYYDLFNHKVHFDF